MRKRAMLAAVPLLVVAVISAPSHAAFPGTGNGKIAFSSYPRSSSPYEEIFTIPPGGGPRTQLTFRPGVQSSVSPSWSPDGTKIVYQMFNADTGVSKLIVMDPSGTPLTSLKAPAGEDYSRPAWSPNNNHVIFVLSSGGNYDLWVWNTTTDTLHQSTFTSGADEFEPAWRPNGSQIAYMREGSDGLGKVWVADIDPVTFAVSGATKISGPDDGDTGANWHPTKNRIVLSRFRFAWGQQEVVIENLGTGTQNRVTNHSLYDFDPAYSPDGGALVWARGAEESDSELIKKNLATGNTSVLTSNGVVDQQPDWQPVP